MGCRESCLLSSSCSNSESHNLAQTPSRIGFRKTYWDSVFWKIQTRNLDYYRLFIEHSHHYTYYEPIHIDPSSDILLHGHFESAEYFDRYRNQILELFSLPPHYQRYVDTYFTRLTKRIKGPFVSLHIRRDDFVTAPDPNDLCLWKDEFKHYFVKAFNLLPQPCTLIVFSDDPVWSQNFISLLFHKVKALFPRDEDFIELYLMAKCDHHIIANSTFSWWGAYLNKNPNKIVIAPKQWTIKPDRRSLIMKNWIAIDLTDSK